MHVLKLLFVLNRTSRDGENEHAVSRLFALKPMNAVIFEQYLLNDKYVWHCSAVFLFRSNRIIKRKLGNDFNNEMEPH